MIPKKDAWKLIRKYDKRIDRQTIKARNGDNAAALSALRLMSEQNKQLHLYGWKFSHTEDGQRRQIEPIIYQSASEIPHIPRIFHCPFCEQAWDIIIQHQRLKELNGTKN